MTIPFIQKFAGWFTGNAPVSGPATPGHPASPAVVDPQVSRAVAEIPPMPAHPLFSTTSTAAYRSEPSSSLTFDELMTVIRDKTASVDNRRRAATEYMEMMNRVRDETIYLSDGEIDIQDLAEQSHQISHSPKISVLHKAITQMLHFFYESSKDPGEELIIRAFFDVRIQFSGTGLRETFTHEDLSLFHSIIQTFEPRYIRPTMTLLSETPPISTSARAYQNTRDGKIYYDQNEVGRYWLRDLFECTVTNVQHDSRSSRSQWESVHRLLNANPQYAGEQTWGLRGFAAGSTAGTLTFIAGTALAAPPLALASGIFFVLGFGAGIVGRVSDHFSGRFEPVPSQSLSQ